MSCLLRWKTIAIQLFGEPVVDGGIVVAAHCEGTLAEHTTVFNVGLGALLVEDGEQHRVLGLARNDDHVVEVLGSGADERNATDVDLLDNFLLRSTSCHSLLKRLDIDDDQVDGRYFVRFHLLLVACIVAAG